mmetsp:Transcript_61637/g.165063  ORF Transcript_61637/g.165063 Transcript_61637/m.165063 type:complete len:229 (-) Transcript_61637:647-1333(-)
MKQLLDALCKLLPFENWWRAIVTGFTSEALECNLRQQQSADEIGELNHQVHRLALRLLVDLRGLTAAVKQDEISDEQWHAEINNCRCYQIENRGRRPESVLPGMGNRYLDATLISVPRLNSILSRKEPHPLAVGPMSRLVADHCKTDHLVVANDLCSIRIVQTTRHIPCREQAQQPPVHVHQLQSDSDTCVPICSPFPTSGESKIDRLQIHRRQFQHAGQRQGERASV